MSTVDLQNNSCDFVISYTVLFSLYDVHYNGHMMSCTLILYNDLIMGAMTSKITGVSMVCSTVCLGADQRKHQCSASLAFMNSQVTDEFPSQRTSNTENVSILWRHHENTWPLRTMIVDILNARFSISIQIWLHIFQLSNWKLVSIGEDND